MPGAKALSAWHWKLNHRCKLQVSAVGSINGHFHLCNTGVFRQMFWLGMPRALQPGRLTTLLQACRSSHIGACCLAETYIGYTTLSIATELTTLPIRSMATQA